MRPNLIFDLDNTLLDFSASEAAGLTAVFQHYGVPNTPENRATYQEVNQGLWHQLECGQITRQQLLAIRFDTFAAAIGRHDLPTHVMETEYRQHLNAGHERVPGAKTLLTHLRASGFNLLAGTNGNTATQHQRLADSHLRDFFSGVYVSETIGHNKPDRAFFDAIFAAEPHLHPQDTWMIGDGLNSDIRGGVNYGLRTVWVNLHNAQNTTNLHPDFEVHTLPELDNLLQHQA